MASRWSKIRRLSFSWPAIEAGTLVAILIVAGGVLVFSELIEMIGGEPHAFDRRVLLALRSSTDSSDPVGPGWIELMFRDITSLGGAAVLILMTAAVVGFLFIDGKRAAATFVLASVGGGTLLSTGLKLIFARPRPDVVPHLVDVSSASFPSGHAMLSAVVYLTLGALLSRVEGPPRIKIYVLSVGILLTLLVGMSRVYLGVHWPTDVLAGWCAGAVWATLCWRIALAL
ncbi:MAG TPA: phosphatase PAP2 family protein, partial [Candidatus Binatia bacterium]|nr:phosphatase PAP2 family protein [Candidatus Binatia bacterium]